MIIIFDGLYIAADGIWKVPETGSESSRTILANLEHLSIKHSNQ